MSELKTLKELEMACMCKSKCTCKEPTPERIKAEAIKWIKSIDYQKELELELGLLYTPFWIKGFFNITEEDLENE